MRSELGTRSHHAVDDEMRFAPGDLSKFIDGHAFCRHAIHLGQQRAVLTLPLDRSPGARVIDNAPKRRELAWPLIERPDC